MMETVKVPLFNPDEPSEGARQPQASENPRTRKFITFADDSESTQHISSSQKSNSTYKDALSQPAPGISHREKLLWLQRRRSEGLWVQCDSCDRWRHMPCILDRYELPDKWFCNMNPDPSMAECSVPESGLKVRDEEDLIHGEYSAGSVVWARLGGWPWWPAMVDDCPDTEQYYWLDGFSDIPTHYNVVFFDTFDVTRAWVSPDKLKPYNKNKKTLMSKDRIFKNRIDVAMRQANDALNLTTPIRLAKYSFVARFKGNINRPKKITKNDLVRYQKQLKRKFNVDFSIESESDSDVEIEREDLPAVVDKKKNRRNKMVNSKQSKKSVDKIERSEKIKAHSKNYQVNERTNDTAIGKGSTKTTENTGPTTENLKPPSSMVVQIGSVRTTQMENTTRESTQEDNDTSTTYVADVTQSTLSTVVNSDLQIRMPSPNSDDFEF